MTNLVPVPSFDDVPQIEVDMLLLGGAGGPMNDSPQALLNRTEFLNANKVNSEDLAAPDGVLLVGNAVDKRALAAPGGAGIVGYQPAGVGAVASNVQAKLRDVVSIKDFGAVGNGVVNDSASESLAHSNASGKAIIYPYQGGESYYGLPTVRNLYGNYQDSLWQRVQAGLSAVPVSNPEPVLFVTKYSSASRDVNPSEWDSGAMYGQLVKKSGSAYGAAVTGHVRHEAGSGQMIGVHGRGSAYHDQAEVWGGWFYANVNSLATNGALQTIGVEIDMNNDGPDTGWTADGGIGASRALLVSTADDSGPCTVGISVQAGNRGQTAPADGFYTGILIPRKSIRPTSDVTAIGNGEAIRLQGSPTSRKYGGIRLHDDVFHYGISLSEASYTSNCAILLADDHRISVGAAPGSSRYLAMNGTSGFANFNNMSIRVTGTQVVGIRKTGWGSPTGISDKSAFATYTAPTISATYSMAEVQAIAAACQDNSRHIAAVISDLINHGLIGA